MNTADNSLSYCFRCSFFGQTADIVANALSTVGGIGNVTVELEVTSVTSGSASWSYIIDFDSIVGDVEELTVVSSETFP